MEKKNFLLTIICLLAITLAFSGCGNTKNSQVKEQPIKVINDTNFNNNYSNTNNNSNNIDNKSNIVDSTFNSNTLSDNNSNVEIGSVI